MLAQPGSHGGKSQQTNFGVEEEFDRPVALPAAALEALKASKLSAGMLRDCAQNDGVDINQIPTSWFVASEVELSRGRSSGLVVRGEHRCFFGAHIIQFWVLSKSGETYRVVFTGKADGMEVLRHRTHGYRDLQLTIVTQAGREINVVTFKYVDGEYRESDSRTEHQND